MPSINLKGHRIIYSVVKGKSRKYTYLRFSEDAVLEVVLPLRGVADPEAIIRERQRWVTRRFLELSRSKRIFSGEQVMFEGRQLKIILQKTAGEEELRPDPIRGEVLVFASSGSSVRELIRRWFLRESSRYVVSRLPGLSAGLQVAYRRADVREIRSWGYCTRSGRLSFSWQLIALPERVREYVLYHELVHLVQHNHSRAFRQKMASVMPDYRQREKELALIIPM